MNTRSRGFINTMKRVSLRGKTATIVGPPTFENFLKAHYITQMTGVTCRFFHEEKSGPRPGDDLVNSSAVILVDCQKSNVESCLAEMKADSQLNGIFLKPLVLFNVAPEDVQRGEEMNGDVKGLLSPGASPDVFLEIVMDAVCEGKESPATESGTVQQR
jgi:hypothetical protein